MEIEIEKQKGKNKRLRNLPQYSSMSDEEFHSIVAQKALGIEVSEEFEKRIANKLSEYEQDYDLSDLKINDRDSLRALIQAHLTLEEYEQRLFKIRSSAVDDNSVLTIEKFHKVMSDLRTDISKLQTDLNINRKNRKLDQNVSLQEYIDSLKEKAKKFYESKMSYIFCPKCSMLLGTVWTLYPNEEKNKIALVCNRTGEDGLVCGEKVIVGTKELIKNGGTNKREITPEGLL